MSFIVMGGAAMHAHGFERRVEDLDLIYRRTRINMSRLARALAPIHPYPRGAPTGLDIEWSYRTIADGYTFITTTDLGDLDLFAEITGGGTYDDLIGEAVLLRVFGVECHCLSVPQLIVSKQATGRTKDRHTARKLLESIRPRSTR